MRCMVNRPPRAVKTSDGKRLKLKTENKRRNKRKKYPSRRNIVSSDAPRERHYISQVYIYRYCERRKNSNRDNTYMHGRYAIFALLYRWWTHVQEHNIVHTRIIILQVGVCNNISSSSNYSSERTQCVRDAYRYSKFSKYMFFFSHRKTSSNQSLHNVQYISSARY